jgi:hypothetical protein
LRRVSRALFGRGAGVPCGDIRYSGCIPRVFSIPGAAAAPASLE